MVTAWLSWSLETECPNCKRELDLSNSVYDPENKIADAIFMNQWHTLNGHEITCEFCETDFILENVEY